MLIHEQHRLDGAVLAENTAMFEFVEHLDFTARIVPGRPEALTAGRDFWAYCDCSSSSPY
jgi:hypothetical protein